LRSLRSRARRYEPAIRDTYLGVSCNDLLPHCDPDEYEHPDWLKKHLGIAAISNVKVLHCQDSFALSVTFPPKSSTSWGKVLYVGGGGAVEAAGLDGRRSLTFFALAIPVRLH
jgi:hypothetical protein